MKLHKKVYLDKVRFRFHYFLNKYSITFLLQAITDGLTGTVQFVEGRRNIFKLDILKLKQEKIQKVGYWHPDDGVNISDPTAFYDSNIANITLVVMTREVRIKIVFYLYLIIPVILLHIRFVKSMLQVETLPTK